MHANGQSRSSSSVKRRRRKEYENLKKLQHLLKETINTAEFEGFGNWGSCKISNTDSELTHFIVMNIHEFSIYPKRKAKAIAQLYELLGKKEKH